MTQLPRNPLTDALALATGGAAALAIVPLAAEALTLTFLGEAHKSDQAALNLAAANPDSEKDVSAAKSRGQVLNAATQSHERRAKFFNRVVNRTADHFFGFRC